MEKENVKKKQKIFDALYRNVEKYLLDSLDRYAHLNTDANGNLNVRCYVNDVLSLLVSIVEAEKALTVAVMDELCSRGVIMKPSFQEFLDTAIVVKTEEEVKRDMNKSYID